MNIITLNNVKQENKIHYDKTLPTDKITVNSFRITFQIHKNHLNFHRKLIIQNENVPREI